MNEFVGLIFTFLIFIYLMLKKKEPEKMVQEEDFLVSLSKEKKPPLPLPPRVSYKPPEVKPKLNPYFEKESHYEVIGKATPSRAHRLIKNLKRKGDMVILKEIIGPPKCR